MILSRRWLEAMLGRALDARDLEHRLSMLGAPVESVVPLHQDLGDVLIAEVLEAKKHPNADRLSLCLVNAGGASPVEVVCGAPNVQAGKKYPYAPVGAVLPGGLKLERRKIRGVESNGMLCSAKELGLGEDHAGIMQLDTDAAPGTRFLDVVPIADHQIVIEVTANRPDLLCHKGVARELGASLGAVVKLPEIPGGAVGKGGGQARSGGPELRQRAVPWMASRSVSRIPKGARATWPRSFAACGWTRAPPGWPNAWRASGSGRSTTSWTRPTTSCSS